MKTDKKYLLFLPPLLFVLVVNIYSLLDNSNMRIMEMLQVISAVVLVATLFFNIWCILKDNKKVKQ